MRVKMCLFSHFLYLTGAKVAKQCVSKKYVSPILRKIKTKRKNWKRNGYPKNFCDSAGL